MKYYEFSFRGFVNETVFVKFEDQETFNKVRNEFYERYSSAKIWDVKRPTKKQKEISFMNHWRFDANDYNLKVARY